MFSTKISLWLENRIDFKGGLDVGWDRMGKIRWGRGGYMGLGERMEKETDRIESILRGSMETVQRKHPQIYGGNPKNVSK